MNTTSTAAGILTPAQVGELVVQPSIAGSVAGQVANVVNTGASSFRVPVVSADPTASWTAEGQEINPSDMTIGEVDVKFAKLAGLSIVSNELAQDSSPAAAQAIGDGLARDLSRQLDIAWFGALASPAPSGLADLANVTEVDGGAAITNTDTFAEALIAAEGLSAHIDHFVVNQADMLKLLQVKKATGSNEPLLGNDPTEPTRRQVLGVPVLVSPAVAEGTIWGIPQDRNFLVVREDATLDVSDQPYFSSHRTAIKAVLRVGFAFAHPQSVVKITVASGE